MNHTNRRVKMLKLTAILGFMIMVTPHTDAAEAEPNATTQNEEAVPLLVTPAYQNYSGLADLVTMICDDALERFQGFYGPTVVKVAPFTTIGFFEKNKQSELGLTLADQMTAVINNDTLTSNSQARGMTPQNLRGVLQELDGYLRVHISGVNAAGERTSFVVTVEMSDPIYRALHTYL